MHVFLEAVVEIGKDIVSRHYIELNETDLRKISDFMADIPEIPGTPDFSANKDKNVVIILVESFNSDVIFHKINGNEITPVMNALVNAENTVPGVEYSASGKRRMFKRRSIAHKHRASPS